VRNVASWLDLADISRRWITNSKEADFFLVFANLDPSKGYKGISCFIVNRSDGLEVAKKEQKVRWHFDCLGSR
jgi:alkylation response protein AidB-like acyl-CoA dehydrogenase